MKESKGFCVAWISSSVSEYREKNSVSERGGGFKNIGIPKTLVLQALIFNTLFT
jgi:hypothetical protein